MGRKENKKTKKNAGLGKEWGDLEIKDYVVLQKPQEQADRLPPPRTLILDVTLAHTRYGRSHVHSNGQLTNTRRSDGTPESDGVLLRVAVRKKILHYHQLYIDILLTVKNRLCRTKYRRNRINFVFFVLFVMLILRGHWG
jgi:hypothetical protein